MKDKRIPLEQLIENVGVELSIIRDESGKVTNVTSNSELEDNEVSLRKDMLPSMNKLQKRLYTRERVRIISLDILQGFGPDAIAQKYSELWGLAYITVLKLYIPMARRAIRTAIAHDETEIRSDLMAMYSYLYHLNMVNKEYGEARRVLDSVARMTQTLTAELRTNVPITTIQLIEVLRDTDGTEDKND